MSGSHALYGASMSTGWWDYVEQLLRAKDWTQADLAEHANLDPSLISNWKNKGAQPRIEALRSVSRAAGVPMLKLLVAAGHITPEEAALDDVDVLAPAPVDVVAAIKNDDNLLPEAKRHLTSQYGLLLRVSPKPESEAAGTTRPPLRAVARRRATKD